MPEVTVHQFAEVLKVPVERLIVQLDEAGIKVTSPEDTISEDAKLELLSHLRKSHGSKDDSAGAPKKITLRRKSQTELRLAGNQGRSRYATRCDSLNRILTSIPVCSVSMGDMTYQPRGTLSLSL